MLKDKIILVTGCSRGIGRAILELFLNNNAIVYANARKENSLDHIKDNIKNKEKLKIIYFDVTNSQECKDAIKLINKSEGRLDGLINNAGIMKDVLIGMISKEDFDNIYNTNVYATMELLQLASRLMRRSGGGSILNMSSIVGLRGNVGQLVYSSSKAAVVAMTLTAAHELGPYGIRVNAIAPGYIETDMFMSVPEDKRKAALARVSLGRIGKPQDVANASLFFMSDLSSYVSGQILGVDGDVF